MPNKGGKKSSQQNCCLRSNNFIFAFELAKSTTCLISLTEEKVIHLSEVVQKSEATVGWCVLLSPHEEESKNATPQHLIFNFSVLQMRRDNHSFCQIAEAVATFETPFMNEPLKEWWSMLRKNVLVCRNGLLLQKLLEITYYIHYIYLYIYLQGLWDY